MTSVMRDTFTFFVSHVQVDIHCDDTNTLNGLNAVWGSARHPVIPTRTRKRLVITNAGIWCDDLLLMTLDDSSESLPLSELVINRLLLGWHADYTSLHAALISRDSQACMLIGESGSGKSSLTWQAVKSGWTFHTDELSVTDGARLWGVRRAIQFDATPADEELPPHFGDADRRSYRWHDKDLGDLHQPIIAIDGHSQPLCLASVSPVFLTFGWSDSLTPISGTAVLKNLYEACFGFPKHDLGPLTCKGYALNWQDPELALSELERLVTTGGSDLPA